MDRIMSVENRENVVITTKEIIFDEEEQFIVVKAVVTYLCSTCGKRKEENSTYYPENSNGCLNQSDKEQMEAWIAKTSASHVCLDCILEEREKERREREEKEAAEKREKEEKKEAGRARIYAAIADGTWSNDMINMPAFDMPELIGTEKQLEWANSIRKEWYEEAKLVYRYLVKKYIFKKIYDGEKINNGAIEESLKYIKWIAAHYTGAGWWIDNRDDIGWYTPTPDWITKYVNEYRADSGTSNENSVVSKEVKIEATVIPADCKKQGVAEIAVTNDKVTVAYKKDDDFLGLVKDLGFRWDRDIGKWYKSICETTGSAAERAAELGNKLLVNGFAICIIDPAIRKAAVDGQYAPEHHRWIVTIYNNKYFALTWEYDNDRIYKAARNIPGSKYSSPYVLIPVAKYNAVLDFANSFDFRLSASAQKIIAEKQGNTGTGVIPGQGSKIVYNENA
ncbi:MAG: hypothetical protein J6F33_05590 [Acidaminococcaceae bacterium]|nr:hypothetical protein [Acidaminococcaceae bacterium]